MTDVILTWDANAGEPWTAVHVYEQGKMLVEVAGTVTSAALMNVTGGIHVYTVRSQNVAGESADSNAVTVNVALLPEPPKNLKYTITVSLTLSN